jgi:glycosyltransferase involved in cell wall biosynthesis
MHEAAPMRQRPAPPAAPWRRHFAALKTAALRSLVPPARKPLVSLDNIAVSGLFRSPTGLGQSARLCRDALLDAGYTVSLIDLCDQFKVSGGVPVEIVDDLPLPGPGILIVHINGPQMSRALWHIGRRVLRDKLIIGYWAWELEDLPPVWVDGARYVHEVWSPSRFAAAAMSKAINRPVRIVPHVLREPHQLGTRPVPRSSAKEAIGVPTTAFVVAYAFAMLSNFERKNPLAAIAAFKRAFNRDRNACLILRCLDVNSYPAGLASITREIDGFDNIRLYTDIKVSNDTFLRAADVYLSLHRSEGFGLTLLEAMAAGCPVIATNWSGNTDFMTAEDSLLIEYQLRPVWDPQGSYQIPTALWAEPNVDAATTALRRLYDDRTYRSIIAAKARANAERFISQSRATLRTAITARYTEAVNIRDMRAFL